MMSVTVLQSCCDEAQSKGRCRRSFGQQVAKGFPCYRTPGEAVLPGALFSHPSARAEALRLAAVLQAEAGELSHEQFVLRVAEIAALADNGHTAIGRNAFMKNTPRIPLRTYLFADGLCVLYANEANADLLGARIDTIDGRSIEDIYGVIRRYRAATAATRRPTPTC